APRKNETELDSLTLHLHAPGAPSITVLWSPRPGADTATVLSQLRNNSPAPLFLGKDAVVRVNGVDLPQGPLQIENSGKLSRKQLGSLVGLLSLQQHPETGLSITFEKPTGEDAHPKFSLGNKLKNAWYTLTGQASEVTDLRQQLTTARDRQPAKFLLAA